MYAGAEPGSGNENRLILQSSDGSTRLLEVAHIGPFGSTKQPPQDNHAEQSRSDAAVGASLDDHRTLACAATHHKMVENSSDLLETARKAHHENYRPELLRLQAPHRSHYVCHRDRTSLSRRKRVRCRSSQLTPVVSDERGRPTRSFD